MRKYFEQIVWTIALLFLFFMDPKKETFSFCMFKIIGLNACLGCGIGHSIHYLLHFQLSASLNEHILGIPATLGIIYLILKPLFSFIKNYNQTWNRINFY